MPQSTPFHLTELDRQLLAMSDEEFVAHDWDNLRDIIGESPHLLFSHLLLMLSNYPPPPHTN